MDFTILCKSNVLANLLILQLLTSPALASVTQTVSKPRVKFVFCPKGLVYNEYDNGSGSTTTRCRANVRILRSSVQPSPGFRNRQCLTGLTQKLDIRHLKNLPFVIKMLAPTSSRPACDGRVICCAFRPVVEGWVAHSARARAPFLIKLTQTVERGGARRRGDDAFDGCDLVYVPPCCRCCCLHQRKRTAIAKVLLIQMLPPTAFAC